MAIEEIGTGVYDFDINAGATFTRFINVNLPKTNPDDPTEALKPFPLIGYVGRAQLRKNAAATVAFNFTVTILADGLISMVMTDEETAVIPCGRLITDLKSRYQWALELEAPTGEVIRLLEGVVRISPEIVK
jgi:hypothetical protein